LGKKTRKILRMKITWPSIKNCIHTNRIPLFWIHLNTDFPFNLKGVLFFPKLKQTFEFQKAKINLYCNQVFVTDAVEQIVPEFLTLLQGVIDSPDIPLNVSRSYLQGDPNVKKITAHIVKKSSR
jgi:molecular chaperone HtpG